jgi:hypothetical protein
MENYDRPVKRGGSVSPTGTGVERDWREKGTTYNIDG